MTKKRLSILLLYTVTILFSCVTSHVLAEELEKVEQLKAMSLENLMNVTVYSAGHKNQQMANVPSAIYVISKEDIRRSGARTLPDLLRGVPGLHVANIDGHSWAISARGFNGVFSNKLLVMIDGRSVYTPLYSGVYWDSQDTFLQDIERIEIIRGPGATIWGANAVNGVINIITESAINTAGGYIDTGIGSTDKSGQNIRYGYAGEQLSYRVYGKRLERDNFDHYNGTDSEGFDDWQNRQAGFRLDWDSNSKSKVTLQGDLFSVKANQLLTYDVVNIPLLYEEVRSQGGNILANFEYQQSHSSTWTLNTYIDRFLRDDGYFDQSRTIFDVKIHNQREISTHHEIVWGGEYRYSHDNLTTSNEETYTIDPGSATDHLISSFIQDEWQLSKDLSITFGTKLEHNDYTGSELQPSLRILWSALPNQSFWASVSRAVRTPSRTENALTARVRITDQTIPTELGPVEVPSYVILSPDSQGHSERLIAYELGWRFQPSTKFSLDTAAFYNDYNQIRGTAIKEIQFTDGMILIPASFDYQTKGYSYGLEASVVWQAIDAWRIGLNYSWFKIDLDQPDNYYDLFFENISESTPEHQVTLTSRLDLPYSIELDTTIYYYSKIHETSSHIRTDIRLGWLATTNLEFSVKGENIFSPAYREYPANFGVISSQVPRQWYAQVKYFF